MVAMYWLFSLLTAVALSWCAMWVGSIWHGYAVGGPMVQHEWYIPLIIVTFFAFIFGMVLVWIFSADAYQTFFENEQMLIALPSTFFWAGVAMILFAFVFGACTAPFCGNSSGVWTSWWKLLLIIGLIPELLASLAVLGSSSFEPTSSTSDT